jgi:hypothetical protein
MKNFKEQIKKNLEANGFPEKKVSLPTEKMYEVADSKGFSLNKVLEELSKEEKIQYKIGTEKIIFSKLVVNPNNFPNINPEMMGKVQEMMSKMDPDEFQKLQDDVANMSEEERKKMLDKAKGMGVL